MGERKGTGRREVKGRECSVPLPCGLSVVHSHVHSLHPYAPQAEERSDDWE